MDAIAWVRDPAAPDLPTVAEAYRECMSRAVRTGLEPIGGRARAATAEKF